MYEQGFLPCSLLSFPGQERQHIMDPYLWFSAIYGGVLCDEFASFMWYGDWYRGNKLKDLRGRMAAWRCWAAL